MSNREIVHEELGITSSDIEEEFNLETLMKWKSKIDEDIQIMSIHIDDAKARAKLVDNYSDAEWFHKINMKKKYYGILSQKIQNQLGIANKRRLNKFERKFIDICRRELEEQTFEELKALTHAEIDFDDRNNSPTNFL